MKSVGRCLSRTRNKEPKGEKNMAKVGTNNGNETGKRVLQVNWQDAMPFALELKQRWPRVGPAMPERIRYLELDCGFPDPRDSGECGRFERSGQTSRTDRGSNCMLLPGILCGGSDDD
jgi:hypothetical protein